MDGNKRLAWAATRTCCLINGRDLTYESVDAAEQFVLDVAAGEIEVPEIVDWLSQRMTSPTD